MNERKTNFKPIYTIENGKKVKLPWKKTYFFGDYEGHGRKLSAMWNSLGKRITPNQVDFTIVNKVMGTKFRKKKRVNR